MTTMKKPPPVKLPANYSGFTFGICTAVKSAGTVLVKVGKQIFKAQCPRSLTVSAGDAVVMAKYHGTFWIINSYFVSSTGTIDISNVDEPDAPGTQIRGTTTIVPKQTATYRPSGWRTDDYVYQGQYLADGNATGCAFYGLQIAPLAGVTVDSASMAVYRFAGGDYSAQQTTLWGVTQNARPPGAPTLSAGNFTGPNLQALQTGRFAVNTTLAQALVDGTYGGVALFDSDGSPYVKYAGRKEYAAAFALTLNWRR